MAQALLLGMPFWWALFSTSKTPAGKIIGVGALGLMTYVLSQTGSRGALISALVVMGFIFLRATVIGKVKLVIGVSAVLLLTAAVLPGELRARYHTFFSAEPADNSIDSPDAEDAPADASLLDSAVGSTSNRMQMLLRSLILTARHPLLGVGPGVFPVAENEMAKAEGRRRGAWLGTHNTFTQVSSECGIPAFLFYTAVLVLSWKKSYALYRRTRDNPQLKDLGIQALALNYSLIAFFGTGLFVHAAYSALLPVLSGLTVALVRTTDPLFASQPETGAAEPVTAPVGYRPPAWRAPAVPAPWPVRNRA
jgi:O-antigen ligase